MTTWLESESYTDTDMRRTIGCLDGLWSQLLSTDGRGFVSSEPPSSVRNAIASSLTALDTAAPETFADACKSLEGLSGVDGWRGVAGPAMEVALAEWARVAERMRADGSASVGRVAAIHLSKGGVPKASVLDAEVSWRGVVGDRQATRLHHGRPWQALCLWSAETIAKLAAEGHPIAPGCAGENITLEGIDFAKVIAGTRLHIGTMICEVTSVALPCSKNAQWFLNGRFDRMHHSVEPGVSRMYAAVVQPGRFAVGDTATLRGR